MRSAPYLAIFKWGFLCLREIQQLRCYDTGDRRFVQRNEIHSPSAFLSRESVVETHKLEGLIYPTGLRYGAVMLALERESGAIFGWINE